MLACTLTHHEVRRWRSCCSRTPRQDSSACGVYRAGDLLLAGQSFSIRPQHAVSQHGRIPQTARFATAPQTAGIYSRWARAVGARRLMYVESQSCFSRGKLDGIEQSGVSQPRYCLEREGGVEGQKVSGSIHNPIRGRHTVAWLTAYQISQRTSAVKRSFKVLMGGRTTKSGMGFCWGKQIINKCTITL